MNNLKLDIQNAILNFNSNELFDSSISLFDKLGYNTSRQNRFDDNSFNNFKESFIDSIDSNFNNEKALTNDWKKVELLFQLTNEEVSGLTDMFSTGRVDNTIIESYLFFAIELKGQNYSRTKLSAITREVNKLFSMPVMILFFYDEKLTLSVINRRLHKRDGSKDVLEKVTLIKDIRTEKPHRAHIEILYDLSFPVLIKTHKATNFVELHKAWEKILDTKELNKKFFKELSNWYFWAVNEIEFPDDAVKERDKRNPISVIRLITRLMFVWFIKEKDLVPDKLFDKNFLDEILNYNDITGSSYYKAILQNLFFATLNTEMNRDKPNSRKFVNGQFLIHNLYRYGNLFKDKTEALKLFEDIPFLNGGLFECLDRKDDNDNVIRIDCFSENPKNQKRLTVPDYLFFGEEQIIDLSDVYGNKKKNKEKVRPIIDILNSYKFTIAENTPIEEEVALDPELLGKVFENLLASYNPETKTTARKQTGSFYTPREIVNYMVDESLIAHFLNKLTEDNTPEKEKEDTEKKLRELFEYNEQPHPFENETVDVLINAIDKIKILDPAAGSGAFPMGILHRLVFLLHKLDPHNEKWKQKQIDKINEIEDPTVREQLLTDVQESFANNELDYGRKLYLIENCIYGVDIQPVAVQIAKLRFFISLVVDQKVNRTKKNFGVRPLPNLETKFVAANTLIGLEKEDDNLFTNPEIDGIKKQLKNVRHRYFTARTHKTKENNRKKDKELREKLSCLLTKEHYLQPKDAIMLANWDPYDQNASSTFFDPEWMFGITKGFDVIIGNPPYVESRNSALFPDSLKNYYRTNTNIRWGKKADLIPKGSDLLIYFFEFSIYYLSNNGINAFITQNAWLSTDYGKKFQYFLLSLDISITINDSNYKHFSSNDGPNINTIITFFTKSNKTNNVCFATVDVSGSNIITDIRIKTFDKKNELLKYKWGMLCKSPNFIIELIKLVGIKGTQEGYFIGQGLNLPQDYFLSRLKTQNYNLRNEILIPIMTSADGAPYVLNQTNFFVINKSKVNKTDLIFFKNNNIKLFTPTNRRKKPSLILPRGLGRYFCALNLLNAYSSSFVEIYSNDDDLNKRIWLFLNSSIGYIIREITGRSNLGGGMLKAEATDLKYFPLNFPFNNNSFIDNIITKLYNKESKNINVLLETDVQNMIDDFIFNFFGISNKTKKETQNYLKYLVNLRESKSKT